MRYGKASLPAADLTSRVFVYLYDIKQRPTSRAQDYCALIPQKLGRDLYSGIPA
jgi:hypothetical protein